jgi:twitching motility protein PilI
MQEQTDFQKAAPYDAAPLMPNALSTTFAAEMQLQATVGRADLHLFQEGLAERLRRAHVAPVQQNGLALRIADRNFIVALPQAGEIIGVPDITTVPLTRPWYRGLANIRGNLVSIIDLSLFLGGPATPLDKDGRVLVFADDLRFNAGILVTHMQGLRAADQLKAVAVAPATSALMNAAAHHVAANADRNTDKAENDAASAMSVAWRDNDGVVWEELNLATLITDSRFLEIGIW